MHRGEVPSITSVPSKGARSMSRMRSWFCCLVLAGCIVPANNPPPSPGMYGTPPPQPYQPPPPPVSYTPPPPAQPPEPPPPTYSDPVYVDTSVEVSGNDVPNVDVFYDQLSPYGVW